MSAVDRPVMPYRRLGRSGLQVSVLSFGSWVTFGEQLDTGLAEDCLAVAREAGVNFFDNAEAYAGGESERIMGRAIDRLGWERWSYLISTKVFWGIHGDVVNSLLFDYVWQRDAERLCMHASRSHAKGPRPSTCRSRRAGTRPSG